MYYNAHLVNHIIKLMHEEEEDDDEDADAEEMTGRAQTASLAKPPPKPPRQTSPVVRGGHDTH